MTSEIINEKEEIGFTIIKEQEGSSTYILDAIYVNKAHKKAIRKMNFTLKEKHNFEYNLLRNMFSRKNII